MCSKITGELRAYVHRPLPPQSDKSETGDSRTTVEHS